MTSAAASGKSVTAAGSRSIIETGLRPPEELSASYSNEFAMTRRLDSGVVLESSSQSWKSTATAWGIPPGTSSSCCAATSVSARTASRLRRALRTSYPDLAGRSRQGRGPDSPDSSDQADGVHRWVWRGNPPARRRGYCLHRHRPGVAVELLHRALITLRRSYLRSQPRWGELEAPAK